MDAKTNEEQGKPNGFALGQLLYDRMHGLEKVECERCADLEDEKAELEAEAVERETKIATLLLRDIPALEKKVAELERQLREAHGAVEEEERDAKNDGAR